MIDIAFGKAGNETSVASATFNFTNHINYIGMTTNNWRGKNLNFRLINRAWRGNNHIIIYFFSFFVTYPEEIPDLWTFGDREWKQNKFQWFPNEFYMEGIGF